MSIANGRTTIYEPEPPVSAGLEPNISIRSSYRAHIIARGIGEHFSFFGVKLQILRFSNNYI